MHKSKLGGGKVVQVCYVVEDLDAAIDAWVAAIGAGPFFVNKDIHLPVQHRGQESFFHVGAAHGQAGLLQIELIQILGKHPSVWTELFPDGGSGTHHIALFVDDLDQAIARYTEAGYPLVVRGMVSTVGFAHMDTRASLGFFTELYQESEVIRSIYFKIAYAARNWDGSNRVRPLADVFPS